MLENFSTGLNNVRVIDNFKKKKKNPIQIGKTLNTTAILDINQNSDKGIDLGNNDKNKNNDNGWAMGCGNLFFTGYI